MAVGTFDSVNAQIIGGPMVPARIRARKGVGEIRAEYYIR